MPPETTIGISGMNLGQRAYRSLRSIPSPFRQPVATVVEQFGAYTSVLRLEPTFIIVGGQRCGTNSLYEYLVRHPSIGRAVPGQEVHYFDFHFDKDWGWYRGHFPTKVRRGLLKLSTNSRLITGECSPYYMFHPLAPQRIVQTLPEAKLLVLLRNPVDRAYSQYQHERRTGVEKASFEEAISLEPNRLNGEVERMLQDPTYYSFNHHHFSYLSRGIYIDQVERLFSLFPRENVMVLMSEQFFSDPGSAYVRTIDFLGLSHHQLPSYPAYNPGSYAHMDRGLTRRLSDYFAESNERLYRLLGTNYRWE